MYKVFTDNFHGGDIIIQFIVLFDKFIVVLLTLSENCSNFSDVICLSMASCPNCFDTQAGRVQFMNYLRSFMTSR